MAKKTATTRAIATANAVRTLAGNTLLEGLPVATKNNIIEYSNPILTNEDLRNLWLKVLVQRIGFTWVHDKLYNNELKQFKKGAMPLGGVSQEIGTNPALDQGFSSDGFVELADGTKLTPLNKRESDTKVLYHKMNRQSQYPVSISREQLQTAFVSWDNLDQFTTSIMNSMYSADNIDEFVYTKNLVSDGYQRGLIKSVSVPNPLTSSDNALEFITTVNTISGKMRFPSTNYNTYLESNGGTGNAYVTWTDRDRQVLILPTEILTNVSLKVLAFAFNMTEAEFRATRIIEIDEFSDTSILGLLCDESFFQIYDNLYEVTTIQNPQGLFWNFFLTHFETLSISTLSNAVVFIDDTQEVHEITTTVTGATSEVDTSGYAINVSTSAVEGTTVSYTLSGTDSTKVSLSITGADAEIPTTIEFGTPYTFTMGDSDVTITLTVSE